jgi:glutathione S-transferase
VPSRAAADLCTLHTTTTQPPHTPHTPHTHTHTHTTTTTAGDLRENLYRDADEFVAAVDTQRTPFMGGERPNLADLAMYGVIAAVQGTDTYNDLIVHSNIGQWYGRMALAVGDSARVEHK